MNKKIHLEEESETVTLGGRLASIMVDLIDQNQAKGFSIYLDGDLGVGKTTFTRGFVQSLGYDGIVKSPTYTLVENYQLAHINIFHFDLYRLADPEELEYIGIREYFAERSICLIEWPYKGEGVLPVPDLIIKIEYDHELSGRDVEFEAITEEGAKVLGILP